MSQLILFYFLVPCLIAISAVNAQETQLEYCSKHYSAFKIGIYEDLLPWQQSGIEERHVAAAEQAVACGYAPDQRYPDAVSIVIMDGNAYIRGSKANFNYTHGFHARNLMVYAIVLQNFAERFKDALPQQPLGFVLANSDHPYQNIRMPSSWNQTYLPILRYTKSEANTEIMIPDFTSYVVHLSRKYIKFGSENFSPWEHRQAKLIVSGFNYYRDTNTDRTTIRFNTSGLPTHFPRANIGAYLRNLNHSDIVVKEFFDISKYNQYKWVLHMDGIGASNRLPQELAMGSLVLREMSGYYAFFNRLIHPWIHYVPVYKIRQEEIVWAVEWAKTHDAFARHIAENGRRFAEHYLTKKARDCFWLLLLHEYAKLQKFDAIKRSETYPGANQLIPVKEVLDRSKGTNYYVSADSLELSDD